MTRDAAVDADVPAAPPSTPAPLRGEPQPAGPNLAVDPVDALEEILDAPVDPVLGEGLSVVGWDLTSEGAQAPRRDPSEVGSGTTAVLLTAAWSTALQTGDATAIKEVAGPQCTFCASIAANAEALPLGPDLELLARVWPVTSLEPRDDYPYPVVVMGLEHLVLRPGTVGEAVHLEVLTGRRQLLDVALVWAEDAWWVHGVSAAPWDGSDPLAP
jgi:hypothetical protein